MTPLILLLALGWGWTPVPEAVTYELWVAPWGQPWTQAGWTTETSIPDTQLTGFDNPEPGELVCITVRSKDAYGNISELSECCGPCEEDSP